jgi:hypothetical protein
MDDAHAREMIELLEEIVQELAKLRKQEALVEELRAIREVLRDLADRQA